MDTLAIIDRLGGVAKTAEICGVSRPAVTYWKRSGIPPYHWSAIVDYARAHQIDGVTFDVVQESREKARIA